MTETCPFISAICGSVSSGDSIIPSKPDFSSSATVCEFVALRRKSPLTSKPYFFASSMCPRLPTSANFAPFSFAAASIFSTFCISRSKMTGGTIIPFALSSYLSSGRYILSKYFLAFSVICSGDAKVAVFSVFRPFSEKLFTPAGVFSGAFLVSSRSAATAARRSSFIFETGIIIPSPAVIFMLFASNGVPPSFASDFSKSASVIGAFIALNGASPRTVTLFLSDESVSSLGLPSVNSAFISTGTFLLSPSNFSTLCDASLSSFERTPSIPCPILPQK